MFKEGISILPIIGYVELSDKFILYKACSFIASEIKLEEFKSSCERQYERKEKMKTTQIIIVQKKNIYL